MRTKFEFKVGNLNCAHCASKVEERLNKEDYIESARLNFVLKRLIVQTVVPMNEEELRVQLEKLADRIERGIRIERINSSLEKESPERSQACCREEKEEKEEREKVKRRWNTALFIMGLILFTFGMITQYRTLLITAYGLISYDIIGKALSNMKRGRMFDEHFLMTLATIAALIIGEYPEAVAVMIFYKIGEYLQQKAVGYSRKEIARTMDIRPDFARRITEGREELIKPERVKVGDLLSIWVGERVPLDGVIIEGSTVLDTSMLTGESVPEVVGVGSNILSGSINKEGVIKVRVTQDFRNSTVTKILEMIESATSKKSKSEDFITKFAKWYTPVVVIGATLIAIIPSIFTGNWQEWLYTAITLLVISCPCAVVISIPLGFFAGLGAAAYQNVLIKGSNYLEKLSHIEYIVLDKTGTITKGNFGISKIIEGEAGQEEIIELAAALEKSSNHPIAQSVTAAYKGKALQAITEVQEISGEGMVGFLQGERILVGNGQLMKRYGIKVPDIRELGTFIYVARQERFLGCLIVRDEVKVNSKKAVASLKAAGIKKIMMLTGDKEEIARDVAREVGIDEVYAELLPHHKVEKLEEVLKQGSAAFVGDGINDAPVLARADIGIAMGGAGADAAVEAADIVLMTDDLCAIGEAIRVAKKTRRIVIQNIGFALGIKVLVMAFSLLGMPNMWLAIFADVGVSLLAVLNSIRILERGNHQLKRMIVVQN